jgi:hypothetical protein
MPPNFSSTANEIWAVADLLREAKHFFYNTSPMDLGKLGESLGSKRKQLSEGIALLKERRSALISAAVTGKIDVRESNKQPVPA